MDGNSLNEHARRIGALVGNLQSLEYQIRAWLGWANLPAKTGFPQGHQLADFQVGNKYVAGAFTDYDSLGDLIKKFNDIASQRNLKQLQHSQIVALRNALAHGRAAADAGQTCPRLIKFSRIDKATGMVTVEYNEVMDETWYNRQQRMLTEAFL